MLQRLLAWHEYVIALAEAGTPLDLPAAGASVRNTLDKYAARVALSFGRGVELPEAIARDGDLPASYRTAALVALRGNEEDAAKLLYQPTVGRSQKRAAVCRALTASAVLFVLALLGAGVLLINLAPALAGIYGQIRQTPDATTRFLLAAATPATLAAIGVVIGATFVGWFLYRRRSSRGGARGLRRSEGRNQRQAAVAQQMASLIRHGVAQTDAAKIAGRQDTAPEPEQTAALPPLVDWAVHRGSNAAGLVADLEFAADVYEKAAQRQADQWRRWAPAVGAAVLGGAMVLAYGLAVFVPVIRLLQTLAQPL